MLHALLCLSPALWATASAHGQQPQPVAPADGSQGTYRLRVTAQTVVLDVVVTDAKGHVVKGLNKDDFLVTEDKVKQVVRTLDASGEELVPANLVIHSTAELDRKAPRSPVNILVLDQINTSFQDLAFADYSLKRFLTNQGPVLPPTMLVAVSLDHFMVLQDFTTSKADLLSALSRRMVSNPWQAGNDAWQGQQLTAALNALLEVAQATSGHPGHKTMIWIGRGFPIVDPLSLDARQAELLEQAVKSSINAMRDARVVLYSLDPAGLSTEPFAENGFISSATDPFGGSVDFTKMATATGGKAFNGRNDVDTLIATSATEGTQFYTLSYVPQNRSEDAGHFRNIEVRMRDPNLTATTRLGYYAKGPAPPTAPEISAASTSHELIRDLSLAGDGLMIYDAVPFTAFRKPTAPDEFLLQLRSSDLAWKPADNGIVTTELSLLVESFDRKGKLLSTQARIENLAVPADASNAKPARMTTNLPITISTAPPAARIRFAIRVEPSGKIGTNNFFFVDPKTLQDSSIGLRHSR